MNLASVVRINAANHGSKPAILFGADTLSFAGAWQVIENIAGQLHTAGVRAGDRVGLCMKDHPVHLLAHYAVARLNAVILPVDPSLDRRRKTRNGGHLRRSAAANGRRRAPRASTRLH